MHLRDPQPYTGPKKIAIAFDIGTTFCATSYVILESGIVPEVHGVTRFPFQELVNGGFKMPSVAYYDAHGGLQAIGAETLRHEIIDQAEQNGWFKSQWFKLHGKTSLQTEMIPPLPPNKTVTSIFGDCMKFLNTCSRQFIEESYPQGRKMFQDCVLEYVISHPNGWAGSEQEMLREAAVHAGLISDIHSEHVHFITEGEASLHFCLTTIPSLSDIPVGKVMLIVDAGGGTVDLSSYSRLSGSGGYTESSIPECLYAGSVFVTQKAQNYFNELLQGTDFEEEVPTICKIFDQQTKAGFSNAVQPQFIRFSSRSRDTKESLGIKGGQMKIEGPVVAGFFQDSLATILNAIVNQVVQHGQNLCAILLVGGYAASPYLTSKINEVFHGSVEVFRPNQNTNKAVADGSLLHYLENVVTSRLARYALGSECIRDYDSKNQGHVRHASLAQMSPTGRKEIHRMFDTIIEKGTRVKENEEFRARYWQERLVASELNNVEVEIMAYDGPGSTPEFLDDGPGTFWSLCRIVADTSEASKTLIARTHKRKNYYRLDYEIILYMGLTELKAQVAWKQNGKEIRSPAHIFFTPRQTQKNVE